MERFDTVQYQSRVGSGQGTLLWFDAEYDTWLILNADGDYLSVKPEGIVPTGLRRDATDFLGTVPEISFDTVGPDGGHEGCLRRPGCFWECFFVVRVDWVEGTPWLPRIDTSRWRSGIIGHHVEVGERFVFSHSNVAELLAELLGVEAFSSVRGPDSLCLK